MQTRVGEGEGQIPYIGDCYTLSQLHTPSNFLPIARIPPSLSQTSSLQTASKYSLWNAVLHLSNNTMVKHIHTSDANQCRTVATNSRTSQCLPVPPASCDWPAQDEMDITGCTPLHPDHSPGSHTVWRWWEGNKREELVVEFDSHTLYHTIIRKAQSSFFFLPFPLPLPPPPPPILSPPSLLPHNLSPSPFTDYSPSPSLPSTSLL